MAASTKPTSAFVSSYSDKDDKWVRTRLEYLEEKERNSLSGSILRRQEIRKLRVLTAERKKTTVAKAVATDSAEDGPPAPVTHRGAQASAVRT